MAQMFENQTMLFSDLALAKRLERAEGHACAEFAAARLRLFPASGVEWLERGGGIAVFDGVDSPVTQCFGLGIREELIPETLDVVEGFFSERGAHTDLEISPLAGVAALSLLCARNYRPIEISSVMYRPVERPDAGHPANIRVRAIGPEEAEVWTDLSMRGWSDGHPELREFILNSSAIASARSQSVCFVGEVDGVPGAAAALCIDEGTAVFAGSTTVPELRRRGLQAALLNERMRYAFDHGCDLAMMVAEAGSNSQRNAERKGFRIAYTRTKWRLSRSL